jgi:hypothetical protein
MGRGIPSDVSGAVQAAYEGPDKERAEAEFGAATWISWGEIARLNAEDVPPELFSILSAVNEERPIAVLRRSTPSLGWSQRRVMTNWEQLAGVLWLLADAYGDDDVRMVVWFW